MKHKNLGETSHNNESILSSQKVVNLRTNLLGQTWELKLAN